MPTLHSRRVYLSNSQLRGEEIQNLARYLPSSKIEHLDLSNNNLGDLEREDISYLASIMQAPRLKILSLGKNNLGSGSTFFPMEVGFREGWISKPSPLLMILIITRLKAQKT